MAFIENPYLEFTVILVTGFVLASIVHIVLRIILKTLASKTKTDLDDKIVHIIIKPMYVSLMLIAIHVALRVVPTSVQQAVWISDVFYIVYTLVISYILARIVSLLITRWMQFHKKFDKTPELFSKIVAVIIYAIAILIALKRLNVEITPFLATLGVGGLAVGLALQNTLSNLFAGLHIISDEPVRVGDYIELEGKQITGTVEDIGWRSTRLKTLTNTIIVIPNSILAQSIVINNTMPLPEMSFGIAWGVAYDSDLEKVEKITNEVAKKIQKSVEGGVKDFVPAARFNKFGESNIELGIGFKIKTFTDKFLLQHMFIKELKKGYDKAGIRISLPSRIVYQAEEHIHRPTSRKAK